MKLKRYGWLSPTGKFIVENPMFLNIAKMAQSYIKVNIEDVLKNLGFLLIVIDQENGKNYAVNDTDIPSTVEQNNWIKGKSLSFLNQKKDF